MKHIDKAGATILPGMAVGKNSVVATGAVVNNEVADNTVVGKNFCEVHQMY